MADLDLAARQPLPDESLDALVVVLDEVRLGRSRSRSELVARTGLGRAIVAQRVGELLERGLVVEGEVGPSTGGRPPRQLSFRASAGHVLVADLGRDEHRRRRHRPRRPDPRPPRRAGADRGRPGGLPGSRRASSSTSCCVRPTPSPARSGGSGSACRARSSSRPADQSRRRSCPAGTATRSASGSRPATPRRSGSTTTSTSWRSGSSARGSRRATMTWSSSRSGRASGRGSSRAGGCTGAPRAAPAMWATSRSRTTRRSCAAAATSAALRRSPAVRRSGAPARRPRPTDGAAG